jgi:hypothetical protein
MLTTCQSLKCESKPVSKVALHPDTVSPFESKALLRFSQSMLEAEHWLNGIGLTLQLDGQPPVLAIDTLDQTLSFALPSNLSQTEKANGLAIWNRSIHAYSALSRIGVKTGGEFTQ